MRTLRLVVALAVLAAAPPVAGQVPRHEGIDAVYRAFVEGYATLDAGRVASLYTEDALYVPARAPARVGREAIEDNFAGFFDAVRADGATLRLAFRIVERRVGDGAAWDLGYYHLARVQGDSVGRPSVGRFVTGLLRGADGRWRFVVDTFEGADLAAWEAAREGVEP